jgi:DNA-directed RNA polymerase specialized sigma24 family protein
MASSTVEVAAVEAASPQLSAEQPETDQPASREEDKLDQFAHWFPRCRNTLHYIADLILNNSEMAERAVQSCKQKASRNLPGFESEGEFRGWIFRVLINEALSLSPGSY